MQETITIKIKKFEKASEGIKLIFIQGMRNKVNFIIKFKFCLALTKQTIELKQIKSTNEVWLTHCKQSKQMVFMNKLPIARVINVNVTIGNHLMFALSFKFTFIYVRAHILGQDSLHTLVLSNDNVLHLNFKF